MSQTMKLSEAIRLGAMLKPQVFGSYNADGGTCALGAAIEAMSGPVADAVAEGIDVAYPEWKSTLIRVCRCPVSSCAVYRRDELEEIVEHLNDDHRLTREQIADWVQTIEAQLEQSSSEVKAEQTEEHCVNTY